MGKGFSKRHGYSESADMIEIESMVASKTGQPAVRLHWGKEQAQFTPQEAIAHASKIIQVACAAVLDAQIVAFAQQRLGASPHEAVELLRLFRLKRQAGKLPSVTMSIDGEPMRPDTAREMGLNLIEMAFMTETEAMLVSLLLEELSQPSEAVDTILQEFRQMRGATTLWKSEE